MFLAICTSTIAFVETEWQAASATGYLPWATQPIPLIWARGPPLDCRIDGQAVHPSWMCRLISLATSPQLFAIFAIDSIVSYSTVRNL